MDTMPAAGQEGDIGLDGFEHKDCSVYLQRPHTDDVQLSHNAVRARQASPYNQVSHL
jgi:hypothetical protein